MEKKFDSIKLWESLLKWGHLGIAKEAIALALKEQGFEFDGEHIVPISIEKLTHSMPPMEKTKFKEKVNRWIDYMKQNPTEQQLQKEIHSWFEESQGEQLTAIFYGLTNCTNEEKSELTEFEKLIEELAYTIDEDWAIFMPNADKYIKEFAPKLLNVARKQVIEEGCEWIKNVSSFACPRRELIESFRNALEKGE